MTDAIIIGAGLFGATIARALQAQGRSVTVFDDNRPLSGSGPSGCLMKPSWFSGMGKHVTEPALELLHRLYNVRTVEFRVHPLKVMAKSLWIPNREVLDRADLNVVSTRVTRVLPGTTAPVVELNSEHFWTAPLVVIAAGFWSSLLTPVPGLVGKQGVSFSWRAQVKEPSIRPWAPYKQTVVFNDSDGTVWGGDGSAIKPENWTCEREGECVARVARSAGLPPLLAVSRVGIRPFVKSAGPCLVENRGNGLWVATGGAKNGTVAAGWAAYRIAKESQ